MSSTNFCTALKYFDCWRANTEHRSNNYYLFNLLLDNFDLSICAGVRGSRTAEWEYVINGLHYFAYMFFEQLLPFLVTLRVQLGHCNSIIYSVYLFHIFHLPYKSWIYSFMMNGLISQKNLISLYQSKMKP